MPTLADLPPELLLSIFLDSRLDYKDLKRFSSVCKRLYKLTQVRLIILSKDSNEYSPANNLPIFVLASQDPSLDTKNFRRGLPESRVGEDKLVQVKEGKQVQYHPFFDYVEFTSKSIDELEPSLSPALSSSSAHTYNDVRSLKADSLPCLEEYATSPPSRNLVFGLLPFETHPDAQIRLHLEQGVKVKDVLQGVFAMWETQTPKKYRRRFIQSLELGLMNAFDLLGSEETKDSALQHEQLYADLDRERKPLLWRQTIRPSTKIQGLAQEVKVDRDDCVRLEVEWILNKSR